jgi:ketosteroid isomerase-like protein
MDQARAHEFVRHWLDAWNRPDIDAVLAHFADGVTCTAPLAARIVEGSERERMSGSQ